MGFISGILFFSFLDVLSTLYINLKSCGFFPHVPSKKKYIYMNKVNRTKIYSRSTCPEIAALFFFLTHAEKRAFSQSKALISA